MPTRRSILVALGGNFPGSWGTPADTLRRALKELERRGVIVEAVSPFYATEAVGPAGQPDFVNAVARVQTSLPPQALLRTFKMIEAAAGRRGGKPWGPRSLDMDIIDYKGLVTHGPRAARRYARPGQRPLVLPHPLAHLRPFVLKPLLDVAPDWRHPSLKRSGRELLGTLRDGSGGRILERL